MTCTAASSGGLPSSGRTATFTYERAADFPGFYRVGPADEPGTSILVSEDFLTLIAANAEMSDDEKLDAIAGFPAIAESTFVDTFKTHYPAHDAPAAAPFDAVVLTDGAGNRASLLPDPLAPLYVRVELSQVTSGLRQFTVSRSVADSAVSLPDLAPSQRLDLIAATSFRLPEAARVRFSMLTQSQLWSLAMNQPAMTNQSVVRTHWVHARIKEGEPAGGRQAARALSPGTAPAAQDTLRAVASPSAGNASAPRIPEGRAPVADPPGTPASPRAPSREGPMALAVVGLIAAWGLLKFLRRGR